MVSRRHRGARSNNRGVIFALSLFLVMLLTVLGSSLMVRSINDLTISERGRIREQAFHVAEAGLDHALAVLSHSSISWSDELAAGGVLSFGPNVPLAPGSYDVRVADNADEVLPAANDPTADVDGIVQITSTGTVADSARTIVASVWSLFNHAIAAEQNVVLYQASAMGGIHANHNIQVQQTSVLLGCSQATASGAFLIPALVDLVHTCGDLVGGDPQVTLFQPNEAALRAALTFPVIILSPAPIPRLTTRNSIIDLLDGEVVGYQMQLVDPPQVAPQSVTITPSTGTATIVVFGAGNGIRFKKAIGAVQDPVTLVWSCATTYNLSVIALDGPIRFEQPVCLRGLIWAKGDIRIFQNSQITGTVISAGGSVEVRQSTQITYNRTVLTSSLLPGFFGVTMLSWQEQQS